MGSFIVRRWRVLAVPFARGFAVSVAALHRSCQKRGNPAHTHITLSCCHTSSTCGAHSKRTCVHYINRTNHPTTKKSRRKTHGSFTYACKLSSSWRLRGLCRGVQATACPGVPRPTSWHVGESKSAIPFLLVGEPVLQNPLSPEGFLLPLFLLLSSVLSTRNPAQMHTQAHTHRHTHWPRHTQS